MRKIKLKLSVYEIDLLVRMIEPNINIHSHFSNVQKSFSSLLAELYHKIQSKKWSSLNNKPVQFSISVPEAYALCALLPLIEIPKDDHMCEATRFKVLNSIEPKLL